MKFRLTKNRLRKYSHIFIETDNWNDWFEFVTLFHLYVFNLKSKKYNYLGSCKIGCEEISNSKKTKLPKEFNQLDTSFFSVGQDVTYYENIENLGSDTRIAILEALNDIAFKQEYYQRAINLRVTRISLLRNITTSSVKGQFRRIAQGNSSLTNFDFNFIPFGYDPSFSDLTFNVIPESNPPTNIHVLIGRNGVGKTHLLNNMTQSLLNEKSKKYGKFYISEGDNFFANLVSINFSAFDITKPPKEKKDSTELIKYTYIGLKKTKTSSNSSKEYLVTKSNRILRNEFIESLYSCKRSSKLSKWQEALFELESDQLFKRANIANLGKINKTKELVEKAKILFDNLSSGHKIVLLSITRLVETVEEKTLVLMDEPETHLHPPLLSAFIRALSNLLISRNGVGIIATHSPVVLQEVPSSCVIQIRRSGSAIKYDRLQIESFGENVGVLTREVFGLEVTHSGFHKLIQEVAERSENIEEVYEAFNGEIGFEGKALARTIMNKK